MGSWNISSNQVYAQADDPGAVGAGSFWTDTNANLTYRRLDDNSGWVLVATHASVSNAEYSYLDGVTSALQTQINAKLSNSQFILLAIPNYGQGFGATRYFHPNSTVTAATEDATVYARVPINFTWSKMYVVIDANDCNGSTVFTSRFAGGAGSQTVTVTASATGSFQDTTNTDSVLFASGGIDYKAVAAGSSGTITISNISSVGTI